MNFFLNGERVARTDATTIEELVTRLQLTPETTLVEHNGIALRRREWPNEQLADDDRVEILNVAAGG